MNWSNKSVLVTGAAGFIGSHLAEALVRAGAKTKGLVRYNSAGLRGWLDDSPLRDEIEVTLGDVREFDCILNVTKHVDVVFHLAALIGIPYSYESPSSYVNTNVGGTLNVLQACLRNGVSRMIHTSTSEVYGSARTIPINEDHPLQAQSPYSATKIGADKLAESFHLSFELPVTTVRPFNTYGPRQSDRAVIPTILSQALAGAPICVGNLHPTRDFNYVEDTVRGFMLAALPPETIGMVINLGTGRQIAIGELINLVRSVTGSSSELIEDKSRMRPSGSEVERLCADNSRARQLLGWEPKVSLREGIIKTVDWMRSNQGRFRVGTYSV